MAQNIDMQNLTRMVDSGYGGGGVYDPAMVSSILRASGANDLEAKRLKRQLDLQESQFSESQRQFNESLAEKIRQYNASTSMGLLGAGKGTPEERSTLMSSYGLSTEPVYNIPGVGAVYGDAAVSAKGGTGATNLTKTLSELQTAKKNIYVPSGFGANQWPGYDMAVRQRGLIDNAIANLLRNMTT